MDFAKIGLFGLLELVEEYGSYEDIPFDLLGKYFLRHAQGILWQLGLRKDKPE